MASKTMHMVYTCQNCATQILPMVMITRSTSPMTLWVLLEFVHHLLLAPHIALTLAPPMHLAPFCLSALVPIVSLADPPTAPLFLPPNPLVTVLPTALAWQTASPTVQSVVAPIVQFVASPTVPIAAFPIVSNFAPPIVPPATPFGLAVATSWPSSFSYVFGSPLPGKGGNDGTLGRSHNLAVSRTMRMVCTCPSHGMMSQRMGIQARWLEKIGWGEREQFHFAVTFALSPRDFLVIAAPFVASLGAVLPSSIFSER